MKHITMLENEYASGLKEKVETWIREHNDEILEIIDIEYEKYGGMLSATITYEEKKK
ncbi:hypothetical protein [Sporosalibacterium faouarense]|uniref:hypothetical protein n=1 Tax=Sporosalibacterium faouarense TaxID=516123 RepID=UPI00192B4D9C|nr:hypothetical protein [Sporosalibacterium faouarense]